MCSGRSGECGAVKVVVLAVVMWKHKLYIHTCMLTSSTSSLAILSYSIFSSVLESISVWSSLCFAGDDIISWWKGSDAMVGAACNDDEPGDVDTAIDRMTFVIIRGLLGLVVAVTVAVASAKDTWM